MAFGRVGKLRLHGRAGLARLGNGGEAVIGDDDDVGRLEKPELAEHCAKAREIVVGIADRRERRRAVDAGNE